jgi:predicted AlkP superfamily pyrophosphatase or phosphodiesterase
MSSAFKRKPPFLFILLLFSFGCLRSQDTTQHVMPGRVNRSDQQSKPYVILISADGFRYDLADKFHAENLIRLRNSGVEADYLQSVFPSLTFPNHYSIATGEYAAHNGIIDNNFYDPRSMRTYNMGNKKEVEDSSWYHGTPLWVLAEKQGMLSACFYWVGAESAIAGWRPTYYYTFNTRISMEDRIQDTRNWLLLPKEKRPHLITFYISDVDHQEHLHGINSKETRDAVAFVDRSVALLVKTIDSLHLDVNYIFVSDHGMVDIDSVHTLSLPKSLDTSHFVILNSLALVHLYARDSAAIMPAYQILKDSAKGYDAYLPDNLPTSWHDGKKDDRYRLNGDILLVARPPQVFKLGNRSLPVATHGFDPSTEVMHASFYAWGPAFKKNLKIRGFENVHIYPLIADILSLSITEPIDGRLEVLQPIRTGP